VGVAFPARQNEAQRIPLLGPERFPVLRVSDDRVRQQLFPAECCASSPRNRRLPPAPIQRRLSGRPRAPMSRIAPRSIPRC
jgi:hypothetical protein